MNAITSRWLNNDALQPFLQDPLDCDNVAILLDNMTHTYTSCQLVGRTYGKMVCRQLVSVQAQPNGLKNPTYLHFEGNSLEETETRYDTCQDTTSTWINEFKSLKSPHKYNPWLLDIAAANRALSHDRKIINLLRTSAGTRAGWSFANADGSTVREKYEGLYAKILELSTCIARTAQHGANWILTSPEVASLFETSINFKDDHAPFNTLDIYCAGTVNNRWKLYKDPVFPVDSLVMGYNGKIFDSGLYFLPHTIANIQEKMVAKYALEFKPDGENYYAHLNVVDFIQ